MNFKCKELVWTDFVSRISLNKSLIGILDGKQIKRLYDFYFQAKHSYKC